MKTKGWKHIFSFTFLQQIKTKSFIISTVIISLIIALIAATANILPVIILEDEIGKIEGVLEGDSGVFSVNKLLIADETGLDPDFTVTALQFGLTAEEIDPSEVETKIAEMAETSENIMLACVSLHEGHLYVDTFYSGENSTIDESDCSTITNLLATQLEMKYFSTIGVTASQMSTAMGGVSTTLNKAGKEPVSFVEDMVNMIVPMISSAILFIFIFSYSQLVAQAVATEKASRVMEYLLTSVSPLSVIIGKVLAMCSVSLMQFLIFVASGLIGFFGSMPFGIFAKIDQLVSAAAGADIGLEAQTVIEEIKNAFSTVNIGTLLIIIVTFILGFLFYSLIAGLAGASISKMEDLAAAIQPMSFIGVLGFYLAYFPQMGNMGGETSIITTISRFVPVSSPFCLPSAYMLNQMSVIEIILALAVLLICDIVLCLIVAKVYEHIVLHTGDRLKISDMLKMADSSKSKAE